MSCHVIRVISHPTDRTSRKHAVRELLSAEWPLAVLPDGDDDIAVINGGIIRVEVRTYDSTDVGEITSSDILYVDSRTGCDGRTWAISALATTDATLWTSTGVAINAFAPGKPLTTYHSSFAGFGDFIMQKFGHRFGAVVVFQPIVPEALVVETPPIPAETSVLSLYDQWLADNEEMVNKWIDDIYRDECLKLTPVHYLATYGLLDILKTAPVSHDVDLGVFATKNNQLDVIKWLIEDSSYTVDEIAICAAAAKRGSRHILKYMHDRAVYEGTTYITAAHLKKAASRGHFHVIEWADKKWYLCNHQHCLAGVYRAAVRAGHVNIVQFLRKKYEINTFAPEDIAVAARAGHLAIVQMAAIHTPAVFSPSEIKSIDGIHPEVKNWVALIYDV